MLARSPGPFRGELGEATEGSIRTFCFIHWPEHVMPTHIAIGHVVPNEIPISRPVLCGSSRVRSPQLQKTMSGPGEQAHVYAGCAKTEFALRERRII